MNFMADMEIIPQNHYKYYMCLFDDITKITDLPTETLEQLWSCIWSSEHLEEIYNLYAQLDETPNLYEAVREILPKLLCNIAELALIIVQHNFTGPFEVSTFEDAVEKLPFNAFVELKENGEEVNPNMKLGAIMVLLTRLVDLVTVAGVQEFPFEWWKLRVIILRQQILQDLTNDLYEAYIETATWLQEHLNHLEDKQIKAIVLMEITHGLLVFQRVEMADAALEKVCELLRVEMKVEGLMGLRTKFQQKAVPQLCLKVQTIVDDMQLEKAEISHADTQLPRLLLLNDDTRLERIRFINPQDNDVMALASILQPLVLLKAKHLRRAQPKDVLSDEEIAPYIHTLLHQTHGPLQVRQSTLAFNCTLECDQRRTVERSWKQCEQIIKDLNNAAYSLRARFSYVFAAGMQPTWERQKQLSNICMSLGLTKTALDHFLQIQDWENVINCYTLLELRHKAEEIIRQELAKQPTVLLYCLLGDATDDPEQFRAAWELSGETSGKAQAYWGSWHFRRQEYTEAVEHLQISVQINSLQEKAWLRLGYAAMQSELWNVAIGAYLFYTHLEPCGFEAWNNLAKCLLKQGNKERAHKMLQNALKHNYNNWKLWENFLVVSADTGNMHEALRAYKTLARLKDRFLDLEVLGIVIGQINDKRIDPTGVANNQLRKVARDLLAEQCIKHGNEYKMWLYSAMMAESPLEKAQTLVKCYKALTALQFDWQNADSVLRAYELCLELCKSSLQAHKDNSDSNINQKIYSQLSSTRLITQACLQSGSKATDLGDKAVKVAELTTDIEGCMELIKQELVALNK